MTISITKSQLKRLIQESVRKHLNEQTGDGDTDEVYDHMLMAMFWSSTDDNGEPMDRDYGEEDLSPETAAELQAAVTKFSSMVFAQTGKTLWEIADEDEQDLEMMGHDLWLTAAEHGAGFWDGDWPKYGDLLTKISQSALRNTDLYVGDDGVVYL